MAILNKRAEARQGCHRKLRRGRDRMGEDAPLRNLCWRFWRGDQYAYVNGENYLVKQSTVTNGDGTGKPAHRVRQTRNLILPIIARKVSGAVQRIPAYDVSPSTTDPEDIEAAEVGEKVALYGYDKWNIRDATKQVVTSALVADEGFAWPYWDDTIGPFGQDAEGVTVGRGDIRIRTFGGNEVFWESGVDFDVSRWHAVEQARRARGRVCDARLPGREADGERERVSDTFESKYRGDGNNLVMVTEYLERPTAKNA
jgi:hypothetical protein